MGKPQLAKSSATYNISSEEAGLTLPSPTEFLLSLFSLVLLVLSVGWMLQGLGSFIQELEMKNLLGLQR